MELCQNAIFIMLNEEMRLLLPQYALFPMIFVVLTASIYLLEMGPGKS